MLKVTDLKNNNFKVENNLNIAIGYCENKSGRVYFRLDELYTKGKNGRNYKTKKLFNHMESWFAYILQERGFVEKSA